MADLTDKEITEACARAMGIRLEWDGDPREWQGLYYEGKTYHAYNPLQDDAQAMALVKKLRIHIEPYGHDEWTVGDRIYFAPDLNRAICLCAARVQIEKEKNA